MFLLKVCSVLENAEVPYAVVGGHAVALHGAVRGTVDIDIVIAWTLENLQKVERIFLTIGLQSRLPVTADDIFVHKNDYIKTRNLIAWTFHNPQNPLEQIDVLINFDLGENSIKRIQSRHGTIAIINILTLIEMKRLSGRPQDLEDIKALELLK